MFSWKEMFVLFIPIIIINTSSKTGKRVKNSIPNTGVWRLNVYFELTLTWVYEVHCKTTHLWNKERRKPAASEWETS